MSVLSGPAATDVVAITEEVWTSFLGAAEPVVLAPPSDAPVGWSSSVTISGDWDGVVSLELTADGAVAVTAGMLGVDTPGEEDIADAIGELVNMVGGGIKSVAGGSSRLSLPVVAAGHVARTSEAVEVCRAELAWAGHPVRITVHAVRPAA